jgi:hypothetical protein
VGDFTAIEDNGLVGGGKMVEIMGDENDSLEGENREISA